MICPHDRKELNPKYCLHPTLRGAILFEYNRCPKCYRAYDIAGNEIFVTKDDFRVIKGRKKAK